MPIYCYKCNDCCEEFEIKHPMSFEEQTCLFCDSDNIFKVPSLSIVDKTPSFGVPKPGSIVNKYINDAKEEMKKEKILLKEKEF